MANLEQRLRRLEKATQHARGKTACLMPSLCDRLRRERNAGTISAADRQLLEKLERPTDEGDSLLDVSFLLALNNRMQRDHSANRHTEAERIAYANVLAFSDRV